MTNRQLVEYYKLLKNEDIIDKDDNRNLDRILDSEASIKEIYEIFKVLYESHGNKLKKGIFWSLLLDIFSKSEVDSEIKYGLNIIVKVLNNHKRYFGNMDMCFDLYDIVKESKDINGFNRLKILDTNISIDLNDEIYKVHKYMKSIPDSDGYISCFSIEDDWREPINDIGAIVLKDGKYKILKVNTLKEYKKIVKIVNEFNYDFVYTLNDMIRRIQ